MVECGGSERVWGYVWGVPQDWARVGPWLWNSPHTWRDCCPYSDLLLVIILRIADATAFTWGYGSILREAEECCKFQLLLFVACPSNIKMLFFRGQLSSLINWSSINHYTSSMRSQRKCLWVNTYDYRGIPFNTPWPLTALHLDHTVWPWSAVN